MIILVLDVNDNEPIFKSYNSSVLVKENSLPGEIASLEATDRDEGPFGQVLYELQEPDGKSGKFQVQTVNGKGVISLVQELDYEKINIYQLEIVAKDQPSFGRRNTATAAILIKVVDVPDQPPQFIHVPSITRIAENLPQGSLVLRVKAVDGDRGVNNQISYSLQEASEHKGLFVIHPSTGQVFVQGTLDREAEGFLDGYILQIEASEVNSTVYPVPSASTEVTVILLDVNDETPRFANDSYIGDIVENAQINIPVRFTSGVAEVVDYDQGKNGTFRLFVEGENGMFDVSPHEGINEVTFLIRVKNSSLLDYEKTKKVDFKIVAREVVASGAKSSSANVTVYIQDSNDNVPQFVEEEYAARIAENVTLGTTVVKIQARDADSGQFGNDGLRYTRIHGQIADRLHLDALTGVITVRTAEHGFDRELVAQYFLTVEARDDNGLGNANTVKLVVFVDDVNDNSPQFSEEKYERSVYENQVQFATPLVVHAVDRDLNGTANSNISYSVVSMTPSIDISMNETSGELSLNSPLDYELLHDSGQVRTVNVTVRAADHGEPSLHTDTLVTIFVMDVNDNIPQFDSSLYSASIPEDTASGKLVLKVHATDADSSAAFGRVIYQMESGFHDKFVVDSQTGAINVASAANLDPDLTRPKTYFYAFQVIAFDGGIGYDQKLSSVLVNITITDVNNKLPEFEELGVVQVLENKQPGEIVANLTATDEDSSAKLEFAFDDSRCEARNEEGALVKDFNVSSMFDLDSDTGLIRLASSFDRETIETVKLLAIVRDVGAANGTQTATTTVTVKIDDVNDNPPVFRKKMYSQGVLENSKLSTHVLTVVAYDADVNKTVSYSLNGSANITRLVKLDSETGDISVAKKIDREQFSWLNFSVLATDSGIPPKASVVNVSVQVLDENDNNPIFEQSETNFSIPEDADPGTKVGVIRAKDADSGVYGKITYLLDKKTSVGKFTIDPNLGVLVVADKLDRETRDNYNLIVEAWDNYQYGFSNRESRNAFKQVFIKVLDVNDQVPLIAPHEGCSVITEYHRVGETIRVIRGSDGDEFSSPNSRMSFSIVDGDVHGLFSIESIDRSSARLVASKSLKQYVGNSSLTIKVSDDGLPPLSSTDVLNVCVTDFNDHAPKFKRPSQNFTVRVLEDSPPGTTIIRVEADDEDTGANGIVKYRIKNDSFGHWRSFAIDLDNGTITLLTNLDRETQKLYQIRVEAFDMGVPTALATDLDLNVYVKNVNDVEPRFTQKQYQVHFTENSEPGAEKHVLLGTVDEEAYDEDEKQSAVCYYIISGNEKNLFDLDKFTHVFRNVEPLDREQDEEHRLVVSASEDCVQSPKKASSEISTMNLLVKVDDVNDNPPVFQRRVFTGGVTTEAQFGTVVLQLQAYDRDVGNNARLTYYVNGPVSRRLTEGVQGEISVRPFIVNVSSGEVNLNFDPQKGMKGYFDFSVLVNDTGSFYDTATVYIYLLRADQRVKFVVRLTPEELREKIEYFRE
uniref:Cadherin domain-containing protein n=1 Tax=Strigamia maritima TaxID=126957 RepID=T1IXK9_STRMM